MYLASGGWALWLKPRLNTELRQNLYTAIQEYDTVGAYQDNWDSLHTRVSQATVYWDSLAKDPKDIV